MMPSMLHLSKFPLPRVRFELAKFKCVLFWFFFISENRKSRKSCVHLFESIQLWSKTFIYDYLIKLKHCKFSLLLRPTEDVDSSKDYLLLGRKWVDTGLGYSILNLFFLKKKPDYLISKAMHSSKGWHDISRASRNQFVSTSSSSFPFPLFQELGAKLFPPCINSFAETMCYFKLSLTY